MNDEVQNVYVNAMKKTREIVPPTMAIDKDTKVFSSCWDDCPDDCKEHPKHSYNDLLKWITDMAGISPDFIGS